MKGLRFVIGECYVVPCPTSSPLPLTRPFLGEIEPDRQERQKDQFQQAPDCAKMAQRVREQRRFRCVGFHIHQERALQDRGFLVLFSGVVMTSMTGLKQCSGDAGMATCNNDPSICLIYGMDVLICISATTPFFDGTQQTPGA
ncbi:hypothetical protein E1832_03275 [Antarcticimicrobium luteum]|uniref:Uncharacterized protein n=1 Tax=Antarcticimicrobium luteum TaxID=2547397 RepID=A0A4R5VG09_9RHOB|nr:hypothetical protein E1832_03275 [Antarcticimicrobium luteum]